MSNESERLRAMLAEKKISKEDYDMLINAMARKPVFSDKIFNYLINPFVRFAGWEAILLGLPMLLLLSVLGHFASVYFVGVFGLVYSGNIINPEFSPTVPLLLYQIGVNWLTMAMLFLTVALIFRQPDIRWIDFFGTTALAQFPYVVATAAMIIETLFSPVTVVTSPGEIFHYHFSIASFISNMFYSLCFIWLLTTYFYALRESSGLTGTRLWTSYLIAMIAGQAITLPATMFFF